MPSASFQPATPTSAFSSARRAAPLGYQAASAAAPTPRSSPTSVADDTFCFPCWAAAADDGGGGHPTPQNLRDNPERLAKVKTEMCHYFEEGGAGACPYGPNCEECGAVKRLYHTAAHLFNLVSPSAIRNTCLIRMDSSR
jgi:hypothetical protein